ncbi:hypothetical protein KC614_01410 [candidate division WWE3 bacterium]|uniref:Type 4 fimbrial biogenesis protein PilX N-terminal domain-containing protein n=1 Tax=candidate division WWE3 bacterium TaxID=2053526 RepID=A0A955LK68_UNCKA|nr:hypothetical protein [candidate division WWE3 bacterium]
MLKDLRNQNGQIVALILLVILVGATIGLSIAGTAIKNIQETDLTEESERAYSAAEAGLEDALLQLENGSTITFSSPIPLEGGGTITNIESQDMTSLSIPNLEKDGVAQVKLGTGASGTLNISWDQGTALVLTMISGNAEPYEVTRYAYNCGSGLPSNGFSSLTATAGKCTTSMAIDGNGSPFDQLLRIRAMYADTALTAEPGLVSTLPVQSVVVKATGQSGETERTVQVERSIPVAPALLDYVLFSSQGSLSK